MAHTGSHPHTAWNLWKSEIIHKKSMPIGHASWFVFMLLCYILPFDHFTVWPEYGYVVNFHKKTAFMVKIILFRVFLRKSFVCVRAFTREWPPFLRKSQASLCEGLRVARTGVSGLRRRDCLGCRNGGTPAMFKVMVKRSNGQMVILDKKAHLTRMSGVPS